MWQQAKSKSDERVRCNGMLWPNANKNTLNEVKWVLAQHTAYKQPIRNCPRWNTRDIYLWNSFKFTDPFSRWKGDTKWENTNMSLSHILHAISLCFNVSEWRLFRTIFIVKLNQKCMSLICRLFKCPLIEFECDYEGHCDPSAPHLKLLRSPENPLNNKNE